MRQLDRFKVLSKLVNIVLLQAIPGFETELDPQFEEACQVFVGLGRYDTIVLMEEDASTFFDEKNSFLKRLRRQMPHQIVDWMTLCGVKYQHPKESERKLRGKDVIGICCIKLALTQKDSAMEFEEEIISKIYTQLPDVLIYSGLGYNEIICIVESDSLENLAGQLNRIREISVENEKSLVLDITTIPCVSIRCKEKGVEGNASAIILLSLRTACPTHLSKLVESLFSGKEKSIFGFHDSMIDTDLPTATLLKNMLELRRKGRDLGLYSTYTLTRFEDPPSKIQTNLTWKESVVDDDLAKIIATQNIPDDLTYYYDAFSLLKNDPFTTRLFRNLHPLFKTQISLILNDDKSSVEDMDAYHRKMRAYFAVLGYLRLAFDQRLTGFEIGNLLGLKRASFEVVGGVQRMIYAAEAAPLSLLSKVGIEWHGFCIFGHNSGACSSLPAGVIIMPRRDLLNPNRFCPIFHESGHVAFLNLLRNDRDFGMKILETYRTKKTEVENYINKKRKSQVSEATVYGFFYEWFSDSFADDFSYICGFNLDWKSYMRTLWTHLIENNLVNATYIARTFLVFVSAGPGIRLSRREAERAFFEELETFLEERNVPLEESARADALSLAGHFVDVAKYLASVISTRQGHLKKRQITKEVEIVKKALSAGIPVVDADPAIIICSVEQIGQSPIAKLAAILSLYDIGVKFYL